MFSIAKKRNLSVLLHILAWMVVIILPQIIINRNWGTHSFIDWRFYTNALIYGLIFYINFLWLIPSFFFKKKKVSYWMLAALVIVLAYLFNRYIDQFFHNPERDQVIAEAIRKISKDNELQRPPFKQMQLYYSTLVGVFITGFSLALKLIEKQSATEKRQKELEKEKLNSELAFLKSQVSPHFFFNTLNNIYSLVGINQEDAQDAILKLSKMMRYLLYESESGKVPLDHEIDFLKHYIDLMQLRLNEKVEVSIQLPDGQKTANIPPLLFIPFIENAFKHGISYKKKSFIRISMECTENQIRFNCQNSIGRRPKNLEENHSGIGLQNVEKRLKLLFPDKHQLKIDVNEYQYEVMLVIDLNANP